MKVERETLVGLFVSLGLETADKWADSKLLGRAKKLDEIVGGEEHELPPDQARLLDNILNAIADEDQTLELAGADAPTTASKPAAAPKGGKGRKPTATASKPTAAPKGGKGGKGGKGRKPAATAAPKPAAAPKGGKGRKPTATAATDSKPASKGRKLTRGQEVVALIMKRKGAQTLQALTDEADGNYAGGSNPTQQMFDTRRAVHVLQHLGLVTVDKGTVSRTGAQVVGAS
jgi:hypothetical protein